MDENENKTPLPREDLPRDEGNENPAPEETVPAETAEAAPAPQETPAADETEEQTLPAETPAQEVPPVEKQAEAAEKPVSPKKSGKGGLIALIAAIAVLVVAIVVILVVRLNGNKSADTAQAAGSSSTATTADSAGTADSAETEDSTSELLSQLQAAYAAHDPDETVLTINGVDIPWSEYFYWLSGVVYNMEYSYGITDFSGQISEDYTYDDYVHDYVDSYVAQVELMFQWAEEEGLGITAEEQADLDAQEEEDVAEYGGGDEAAFAEYLAQSFITPELYDRINQVYVLMQNIYTDHYGENGEKLTDQQVLDYAEDQGYMYCKHILFSFDSTAEDADADKAAKKEEAQAVLDQLISSGLEGKELEELFDQLMTENTDDTGLATYPDGYLFTSGTMVTEFEDATAALGDYELSDLVETSYGYHIILRLPLDPDATAYGSSGTLRQDAADALFEQELADRMQAAVTEYLSGFETVDVNQLLGISGD